VRFSQACGQDSGFCGCERRDTQYQPYSQGTSDMIFPMMTVSTVLGNEGVFAYHLLAGITQRWQMTRATTLDPDKCY